MRGYISGRFKWNKRIAMISLMMLPGALWLFLLRYLPIFGIAMAFQKYEVYRPAPTLLNNILHSKWNNFENFRFMFATTDAALMMRNTLAYNAAWIALTLVISVSFAIMLSELTRKYMAKAYQTLMFFPYFISWVVVSYFVFAFLAPDYGLLDKTPNWYGDPWGWPVILTISTLWKGVGYSSILYLAAITGVDSQQFEAASIDGASKWQQAWHITLPNIRPMIVILFILSVGRIFNADFGLFYNVTKDSGALYPVSTVIDTYVFRALMASGNIGMSTAAGVLQNVLGFICIMAANAIARRIEADYALF